MLAAALLAVLRIPLGRVSPLARPRVSPLLRDRVSPLALPGFLGRVLATSFRPSPFRVRVLSFLGRLPSFLPMLLVREGSSMMLGLVLSSHSPAGWSSMVHTGLVGSTLTGWPC